MNCTEGSHGVAHGAWWTCDAFHYGADCSICLDGDSARSTWVQLNNAMLGLFAVSAVVSVERTARLCVAKCRAKRSTSGSDSAWDCLGDWLGDVQLQVMLLMALASAFFIGNYCSPQYYTSNMCVFLGVFASELGGARTARIFVSVYARFHPPSRKFIAAIDWSCLLCVCVVLVGLALSFQPSPAVSSLGYELVVLSGDVLLFGICLTGSIYAFVVLRPPPESLRRRQTHEQHARSRLIWLLVFLDTLVVVAYALTATHQFNSKRFSEQVRVLVAYILLVWASLLAIVWIAGRKSRKGGTVQPQKSTVIVTRTPGKPTTVTARVV